MFFVRQTAACDSRVSELSEKSVPPSDGDFTIENEVCVLISRCVITLQTVGPLNNGMDHFVHHREVVLFRGKNILPL